MDEKELLVLQLLRLLRRVRVKVSSGVIEGRGQTEIPLRVDRVVVNPVGDGRYGDSALEYVALVRILLQNPRGQEAYR